jgi:hypothetical protein
MSINDYDGKAMPAYTVNGNSYMAECIGTCDHGFVFRKTAEISKAEFESMFPDKKPEGE